MGRTGTALARVESAFFEPAKLPEGGVVAIAIAPAVAAGLVFFKVAALEALGLALAAGLVLALASWRARLGAGVAPVVAAVIGVGLLGPGAPPAWMATTAALAAALEVARRRWLPGARVQAGVVAAAAVFLASRGLTAAYLNPGRLRPLDEPIRLWSTYFPAGAAPIDPVRLYVGNVPGPMFATSVLAVVVGAAWLWYARRLSIAVLIGFAAGAVLPILVWHWSPAYQLESGPTWFLVALVLADRAALPTIRAARPLLGLAVGVIGVGLRHQGLGIEIVWLTVAGLQLGVAAVEAAGWLAANRQRVRRRVRALRRGEPLPAGRRTAA